MSILDTIMSALRSLTGGGTAGESEATGPQSEGQVSVEYDPEEERPTPDAATEAAVKGGDVGSDDGDASADVDGDERDGEDAEAAAAGTDAAASTGTLVDEDAGKEPAETVGEAGGVDVDRTTGEGGFEDAEPEAGADDAEAEPDEPAAESDAGGDDDGADAGGSTEPVETIKGIGPAYAGRLEGVGIETVGELAAADAAEVAEGIDVSESRVSDWIERATDAS